MASHVKQPDLITTPTQFHLSTTPISEFTAENIHLIHDASAEALQILANGAARQQPPNEGVLGAIGAVAAVRLLDCQYETVDESQTINSIIEKAFPAAEKISHYPLVRE